MCGLLSHVRSRDRQSYILNFKIWRLKIDVFEHCVNDGAQTPRPRIILLIQLYRNARNFVNRLLIKHQIHFFSLEKLNGLQKKIVLRVRQNVLEVVQRKGFHLGSYWKTALEFNC